MKITLKLDETAETYFNKLKERVGCKTETELLQKALALFDCATEHQLDGGRIVFRYTSGKEELLNIY